MQVPQSLHAYRWPEQFFLKEVNLDMYDGPANAKEKKEKIINLTLFLLHGNGKNP